MKNDIEAQYFKPKLNPKSDELVAKRRSGSASSWTRKNPVAIEASFTPKINEKSKRIVRTTPIEVLLHTDAKRRAHSKSNQTLPQYKPQPVAAQSEILIYKRLLRDLGQVYIRLSITKEEVLITKRECLEIMT
jgi:hypothetical protein